MSSNFEEVEEISVAQVNLPQGFDELQPPSSSALYSASVPLVEVFDGPAFSFEVQSTCFDMV